MNPTNWRESFDKTFSDEWWNGFGTSYDINQLGVEGIKAFITSLLSAIKDEVGKEKTPNNLLDKGSEFSTPRDYRSAGWNSALTKVEDIISQAIEG